MSGLPSTKWSVIAGLAGDSREARGALVSAFLNTYRRPLEVFLAWRFRDVSVSDREDLLQGFIADRLLAADLYRAALDRSKKFRPYLCRSLINYAIDQLRRQERSSELNERYTSEANDSHRTADPYDYEWARTVIVEAMLRLRHECIETGRTIAWDVFDLRVRRPAYYGQEAVGYDVLGAKFGRTEHELRNLLVTAKRIMRRHMLDIVGGYVAGEESAEEEIRELRRIVSAGLPKAAIA